MFTLKLSTSTSLIIKRTVRVPFNTRFLSTTPLCLTKNPGFDKDKVDNEDSLMEKAPGWNEKKATESEADVKADKERTPSPKILEKESAEWIKSHNKQSK